MKLENRFKRLCFSSEAIEIEEKYFQQQNSIYESQFRSDFSLEYAFLSQNVKTNIENKSVPEIKTERIAESSLKKLHRALAKKTHPDKKHIDDAKEFMSIQKAYENAEVSHLLSAASKYNLNVELHEDDIEKLEQQIEMQRKSLKTKKNTLWWVWNESDMSGEVRKQMHSIMGIDQIEFENWCKRHAQKVPESFQNVVGELRFYNLM